MRFGYREYRVKHSWGTSCCLLFLANQTYLVEKYLAETNVLHYGAQAFDKVKSSRRWRTRSGWRILERVPTIREHAYHKGGVLEHSSNLAFVIQSSSYQGKVGVALHISQDNSREHQGSDVISRFESLLQKVVPRHSIGTKDSNYVFRVFRFGTRTAGLAISLVTRTGLAISLVSMAVGVFSLISMAVGVFSAASIVGRAGHITLTETRSLTRHGSRKAQMFRKLTLLIIRIIHLLCFYAILLVIRVVFLTLELHFASRLR